MHAKFTKKFLFGEGMALNRWIASLEEETLASHHLAQSAGHLNAMLILWFMLDHGHIMCAF